MFGGKSPAPMHGIMLVADQKLPEELLASIYNACEVKNILLPYSCQWQVVAPQRAHWLPVYVPDVQPRGQELIRAKFDTALADCWPQWQQQALQNDCDILWLPLDTAGQLRRYPILACDMDSTLTTFESMPLLAGILGQAAAEQMAAATEQQMLSPQMSYADSFSQRHALLAGLSRQQASAVFMARVNNAGLRDGAGDLVPLMQPAISLIVTGGYDFLASELAAQLGFNRVSGNQPVFMGDQFTASLQHPIKEGAHKLTVLKDKIPSGLGLQHVVAIGDGSNDREMLQRVQNAGGLAVAVGHNPELADVINHLRENSSLLPVLYAQGLVRQGR